MNMNMNKIGKCVWEMRRKLKRGCDTWQNKKRGREEHRLRGLYGDITREGKAMDEKENYLKE